MIIVISTSLTASASLLGWNHQSSSENKAQLPWNTHDHNLRLITTWISIDWHQDHFLPQQWCQSTTVRTFISSFSKHTLSFWPAPSTSVSTSGITRADWHLFGRLQHCHQYLSTQFLNTWPLNRKTTGWSFDDTMWHSPMTTTRIPGVIYPSNLPLVIYPWT